MMSTPSPHLPRPPRPNNRRAFEIAIICALSLEADAIETLFDHYWDDDGMPFDKEPGDPNAYSTGVIGRHNVVLAYMPGMGKVNAAAVASNCRSSFPGIKLALVVGICGVVPFKPTQDEIVLGDVIISNGIVQYDFGRQLPGRFSRKDTLLDSLGRPNPEVRGVLAKLEGLRHRRQLSAKISDYLDVLRQDPDLRAQYPGCSEDKLFEASYRHTEDQKPCDEVGCNGELVLRSRLETTDACPTPAVHFGLMASGDSVMKSGDDRDRIAAAEGVIAFEMEGAGVWDSFPCIVIKGACDYADSHKSKVWQRYAAATAAACAKAFLSFWVPSPIQDIIHSTANLEIKMDNARGNGTQFSLPFSLSNVNEANRFVARGDELAKMQEILAASRNRNTVVIHGLGGMGKTQLAIEFSKRNHAHYSAVLWMNATDEETLKQSIVRVAERVLREHPSVTYLERAIANQDTDETVKGVERWLSERANNRWLIIYDNYDHPLLGGDADVDAHIHDAESQITNRRNSWQNDGVVLKAFDIRPFLPKSHHGAIIVTTRSATVKLGQTIRLSKLERIEDSLQILESTSNREQLGEDPASVQLARKLDGLPLALSTAGAYLDQVSITCKEYLELYKLSWYRLQRSSPQVLSYEDRAMYSTWNVSYLNVEKRNQSSAMLLKLWAYFDHDDLWYELLCGAGEFAPPWLRVLSDKLTFMESIRLLCDYGLVEANSSTKENGGGSPGYSVHGCVHDWMFNILQQQIDVDMVRIAVICVASLVPSPEDNEFERLQRRLLQHVNRCLDLMTEGSEIHNPEPWTYGAFGNLYTDQGRLDKAEAMYNRQLQDYERTLGPDHISTLITINNLGLLYNDQGRLDKAEAMYERALQGYEKTMGPEYISTHNVLNNLGLLYNDQGRLDEAETIYERALQGKEKALGPDHTSTLNLVHNMGNLYIDQGKPNKAEAMYERALQGHEKALGPDHTSTLNSVQSLGILYYNQGWLDKAETMYERALQGYEKAYGSGNIKTLNTINNLGILYARQGKPDKAEVMYERALQGFKKALDPVTLKTYIPALNTIECLGVLYQERNKPDLAQRYYLRAQEGYKMVFGDNSESERVRRISRRLKNVGAYNTTP